MSRFFRSLKVFSWLLWRDVRVLYKNFTSNLIDALSIPTTTILISGYILPYLGIAANYGSFMAVSTTVMMCFSATGWRGANILIMDLDSDKAITYELTLPLPYWLVFVKAALAWAIEAMFINILTIPVGKLLLGSKFDISHFSFIKFIVIYVSSTLLFAFYYLWASSWIVGSRGFGRFNLRYSWQLLLLSCNQFPWQTLYAASPVLAYFGLLSPFVYAFEGVRASVLGQAGSLNYWLCLMMLWTFTIIFGLRAIVLFKKRLDCI